MQPSSIPDLPTPLARILAARIAAGGAISVHDYVEACLADPEHGYYRKANPLGGGGDFITAPEISQIFGELIGLWAGEVWRTMGEPRPVRLIELGPGRGLLMADALRALRVAPRFLDAVSVYLIETSEPLRSAQRAALASAPVPVSWHDLVEEAPDGASIVIANEFFDCLPVRQHVFDAAASVWRERMVAFESGSFQFALGAGAQPADAPPNEAVEDGAIIERRPGAGGLIRDLAARAPVAALIVDYGYSRPSLGDTLQAVKSHRFAGVFDAPGETDLTAHVDFPALRDMASKAGMSAFGPMPMGEWLLRLGLEARLGQLLARADPEEAADLRSRAARLVDPAQMGALFKVIALTGGVSAPPPPFL